ncbi:MAG: hypothetical protein AB7I44_21400 [Hyphomicrobiaceae bacterium]
MAYQTGTASDFAELRTELFNFCQLQGYTLIGGQMLQKGDVYAQIEASTTAHLRMRGGTGQDGSGNPTGAPHALWTRMLGTLPNGLVVTWPITYHFHYRAGPDAVFVAIEHNNGFSQHLLFGEMSKAANFVGGGYYSASWGDGSFFSAGVTRIQITKGGVNVEVLPFQGLGSDISGARFAGSYVHAETGGRTWWEQSSGIANTLYAGESLYELRARSLNPWNNGMNLVPWYLFGLATSANLIVLGELPQIRFCRMRHYNIADVITIGADKWKLYPVLLKNAAQPDPGAGQFHSGDYGIAVAYDGP